MFNHWIQHGSCMYRLHLSSVAHDHVHVGRVWLPSAERRMESFTVFVALTTWSHPSVLLAGMRANWCYSADVDGNCCLLLTRRPIEGRIIHAVGKTWHPEVGDVSPIILHPVHGMIVASFHNNFWLYVQHFVCAHCEKAFEGRRHFEKKGLAYCERDYKAVRKLYCSCRG